MIQSLERRQSFVFGRGSLGFGALPWPLLAPHRLATLKSRLFVHTWNDTSPRGPRRTWTATAHAFYRRRALLL